MNSLDITSLYTNIPQLSYYAFKKNSIQFTTLHKHLIDINKHITNMTYFKFNNKFREQKSGLRRENPLSGVLTCLFLSF